MNQGNENFLQSYGKLCSIQYVCRSINLIIYKFGYAQILT